MKVRYPVAGLRCVTDPARQVIALVFCLGFALLPVSSNADPPVFASGLDGPVKLDVTQHGSLLVTERGHGNNDGRLTIIDRWGNARPLLEGLPSGFEVTNEPSGPTGVQINGCCLIDLVMGEGDSMRFQTPPKLMPNPVGSVSPIFSSLLRLIFDRKVDHVNGGFTLTRADHDTLADGKRIKLQNSAGERLWIELAADMKDFRPDPAINVRNSNPFAIADGKNPWGPIIVDAGGNSLVQVRLSGPPKTLLRFAPVANPAGVFPPFSDAVPTSVRHYRGDKYLVTLFVGVPFQPGTGSVRLVDLKQGTDTPLITGLTSATDVLPIGSKFYVLELSANLGAGAPGRLLRFSNPGATPKVLATGLIGGSGMVYSPKHNAIFVSELFLGQIRRIDL